MQEAANRAGFGDEPQHLAASKALALEAQKRWVEKFDAGEGCVGFRLGRRRWI